MNKEMPDVRRALFRPTPAGRRCIGVLCRHLMSECIKRSVGRRQIQLVRRIALMSSSNAALGKKMRRSNCARTCVVVAIISLHNAPENVARVCLTGRVRLNWPRPPKRPALHSQRRTGGCMRRWLHIGSAAASAESETDNCAPGNYRARKSGERASGGQITADYGDLRADGKFIIDAPGKPRGETY